MSQKNIYPSIFAPIILYNQSEGLLHLMIFSINGCIIQVLYHSFIWVISTKTKAMRTSSLPTPCVEQLNGLQSRLKKSKFFNKDAVPGSLDAHIFKTLQKSEKIGPPSRTELPNLYHWYILMKQFSTNTLQKWISSNCWLDQQDSKLVQQLKKTMEKCCNQNQLLSMNNQNSPTIDGKRDSMSPDNEKSAKNHSPFLIHINRIQKQKGDKSENQNQAENEYIMDIRLNEEIATSPQSIKFKLLEKIDLSNFQILESGAFRIHFKSDCYNCQSLKDSISNWPQVQNIQVRKEKRHASMVKNKQIDK